jgi:hypothetical protein
MPKPPKSADQGDSDDPAQTSKEALAKIAESAPPMPAGEPSMAPIAHDKDGPKEHKLPKRGGLPPENDPPAA